MATKQFRDFIDQVCKLVNIKDPERMYESADLDVDGVKFTVVDHSRDERFCLALFGDFGQVPKNNLRAPALQRLMEINLWMFGINTPHFSVNPETDHVLLIGHFDAQDLMPEDLLKMLGQFSAKAKEWQKTYFLTPDEQADMSGKRVAPQQALFRNLQQVT